ncbi:MAG TPA: ShlB/FhaC/HecB family hemolysin secretion/activation protein [Phenylobacterium sp.]|nr:ShlB/FhaC/HecB family hemolysin secretion/activation protein [Phenylobacterium sp.]
MGLVAAARSAIFGAAAAAILAPSLGGAQTAPGLPSRDELNPARRAAPQAPRPDLFLPPAAGPCPLEQSDVRLTLNSVTFRGLTGAAPEELAPAYAEFLGREGPVSNLCVVRDRVADALFRKGLLTRVEIPQQEIAGGALTLEVIEAKIVNVQVRGDAGPATPLVEAYAEKLRGLAPFDLDIAQRYLLLASDIPGLRVRATVRPNRGGERGAVDLDLTVARDPYDGLVNVQNMQAKATGRWGALGRVDFNSFTAFGERTSLVLYHTLDDEQWVVQLLEEARFGGDGLLGRLSLVYGESEPGGVLAPLDLKSESFVGNAELAYPLIRKRRQNLTLAAGIDWIDQTTDIGGGGTFIDDSLRVAYVRAEADWRPMLAGRSLTLGASASVRQGLSGLGASDGDSPLLSRADADPSALVFTGSAFALAPIAEKLTLYGRVEAQYSNDALLAYEELPVGNLTIGRGYDPAALSGDSGVAATLEARTGPFPIGPRVLASPYLFYDVAHVDNNDAFGLERTVDSAGVGVQFRLTSRATLDLVYAKAFDAPLPGAEKPGGRLMVNLTASLF